MRATLTLVCPNSRARVLLDALRRMARGLNHSRRSMTVGMVPMNNTLET